MEKKFDISAFVGTQTIQSVVGKIVDKEKSRRKKMGVSQKTLSEKSGVSYASLRRFESTGEISLNSLLKIANALDCLEDFTSIFRLPPVKNLKDYDA